MSSTVCSKPGVDNWDCSGWVHKGSTPLACGGVTDSEISHTLYTGWKHTVCRCLVLSRGSIPTALPASFLTTVSPPLTSVALPRQPSLLSSQASCGGRQGWGVWTCMDGEVGVGSGRLKKDKKER